MTIDDIVKIISRAIAPLKRKILLSIAHGLIEATKDDGDLQFIQATYLEGETKNGVRKMHHYGFSSHAPPGSECIAVSVAGNREASVIIATENREFRFKNLGEGEVAISSKDGDFIHLKDGNAIDIKTSTLTIDASDTTIKGTLTVEGIVTAEDEIVADKSVTATENFVATGDVTGANVVGLVSAGAPAIAAAASLIVAGTELSDYSNHTHQYDDDNGSGTTTKSTAGVS